MSGAQQSGFANVLFNPLMAGQQQAQQNQLQMQQMDLTAADHEQVGRLAAGLLNIKDPTARAQAYAQGVGVLQSQGLAKYAPPTLPDEQSLQMLVSQTIPVQDQYKLGIATPAGTTAAINAALTPGPPSGGTGASATPAGGGGDFGTRLAQSESGGKTSVINPQGYTGTYQFGKQRLADLGYYTPAPGEDMKNNTAWAGKVSVPGFNVTDQQSFAANPAAQQAVFNTHLGNIDQAIAATPGASRFDPNGLRAVAHLGGVEGMQKFVASGGVFSPSDANGTSLAAYYNKFSGGAPGGATTASTAPTTAQPGQPVPTQVASNTPMVSTAPGGHAQPPAQTDTTQPPAPVPPPASSQANLPHASSVPTGASSQQYQQAMDLQRRAMILDAQPDPTGRLKTLAAGLRSQAALALQNDSVVNTQEGQLHTLTGKLDDPAKPLADYHETTPGSGIWVGGPGTEPKFQPPGRLIIDKAGDVWRTTTGGAEKLSRLDPAAVAALNEAAAAGTATGTAVAKQLPELMTQARNAAAQEGQIDYATNQLREATKGGIPTGYFSQGLATAAAAAKSLGLTDALRAVGVNPEAVGNVQTAQKTLSVIGGAILRQALGPGSAVTDAKVEQFIHTQPGIETDPQALQRIMAWARSQFTYERELGTAAVAEAAKPENAGRLPPHFLAAYYRDHGFAPIYDTGTQEMQQPDGRQPSRETPPPASTKRPPLSSFQK